jgi:hypothetical protein
MRKIIAVMMLVLLLALTGCTLVYGENVYMCNPKNMLGFRRAYIKGEHIRLCFDEEYALQDSDHPALKEVFESGEFPDGWSFYVIMDAGGDEVPVTETITVDPKNMTISFDKSGATVDNVRGFSISSEDDTWTVNFGRGYIKETHMDGETEIVVIQRHDSKDDFWYPAETVDIVE